MGVSRPLPDLQQNGYLPNELPADQIIMGNIIKNNEYDYAQYLGDTRTAIEDFVCQYPYVYEFG
jgi:hypothetical protein